MEGCQQPLDMPVCKHLRPIKVGCTKCYVESYGESISSFDHVYDGIEKCFERIESIEGVLHSFYHLIESAKTAEALFAKKVHELQSIDKKRDDVINALCQKVEALTKRVIEDHPHPLLGRLEGLIDKF